MPVGRLQSTEKIRITWAPRPPHRNIVSLARQHLPRRGGPLYPPGGGPLTRPVKPAASQPNTLPATIAAATTSEPMPENNTSSLTTLCVIPLLPRPISGKKPLSQAGQWSLIVGFEAQAE